MLEEKQILNLQREIEKLRAENADLKKRKKFGLVWEEQSREKDIDDKEYYPFLATKGDGFGFDNGDTRKNLLIEGDNYHALEILQYTHKGAVDVIYIDPPYNTGKKKEFRYNDHWVDKEDGYRHSKWLTFMEKRLRLAKELLKKEGVVFVSIDDNEQHRLRMLMDDIFIENNFVAQFIWQKKKGGGNDSKHIAVEHEYILMYAKNKMLLNDLIQSYDTDYAKRYKEQDDDGRFYWDTFKRKSGKQYYPITCPDGTVLELDESGNRISWLRSEARFYKDLKAGEVKIEKSNNGWSVYFKQRMPKGKTPRSLLREYGTTSDGSKELLELFTKQPFENPKPLKLLQFLIEIGIENNGVVLDFFAGSGTTGHAVMDLAFKEREISADEETNSVTYNPQFILVTNNENNICEEVCYERLKRANEKYGYNSNLEYLKTELLEFDPERHCDMDIREFMVEKMTDIIKVKEACFSLSSQNEFLQKFVKEDKSAYILHHVYDMSKKDYEAVIDVLSNDDKENISIYILSMSNHAHYAQKLSKCGKNITVEPLPESFLKLLRKIDSKMRKAK